MIKMFKMLAQPSNVGAEPPSHQLHRIGLLLCIVLIPANRAVGAPASWLENCRRGATSQTETWDCFVTEARRGDAQAARRFLAARATKDGWENLAHARLLWTVDAEAARERLFDARRAFVENNESAGCIDATFLLARRLGSDGAIDEAIEELGHLDACGRPLSDDERLRMNMARARLSLQCGEDLGLALEDLRAVDSRQLGERDQLQYWDLRARLHYELSQPEQMLQGTRTVLEYARSTGDLGMEASRLYNSAIAWMAIEPTSPWLRGHVSTLVREALQKARRAANQATEIKLLHLLGRLSGESAREHLAACVDLATRIDDRRMQSSCLAALALASPREDRRSLLGRAEELAARTDVVSVLHLWPERFEVDWATLSTDEATARSFEILDLIDDYRLSQDPEIGRAGVFATWNGAFAVVAGRLLERGDLAGALHTMERMRARSLLDSLVTSRAQAAEPRVDSPALQTVREMLHRQIDLQLELIANPDDPERLDALRAMQVEEARLWDEVNQQAPDWAALAVPSIPPLEEIQDRLAPNEAIVAYQVAEWQNLYGDFDGGSWAFVIDRGGARVHRLPGLAELQPAIDMLDRLPSPDAAPKALEKLQRSVLGAALDGLPDGVERLILVPDGPLHQLPWAALRLGATTEEAESRPLTARYSVSVVPSLTLWHRWRARGTTALTLERRVVALADPTTERVTRDERTRRWLEANGRLLDPLPWARREGGTAVAIVGAGVLLAGEQASEKSLHAAVDEVSPPAVLHFAAHAVADLQNPSRSAVVLAADGDDDGLLLPHEIARLPLDGSVIVLSTCDSAAGQVLRGEGALSLARPFFRAGAPVVVASLRPVRDRATSELFERFYRSLARGASAGDALALAQAAMAADGHPAADWSSFVLLGDGAVVPFPGGAPATARRRALVAGGVLAAAVLVAFLAWLLRRARPGGL